MKLFFATAVLMGFAGVMLFGVFLMMHLDDKNHTNCLPMLMGTNECNDSISPLEYVRVHLGAITELINAIPIFGVLAGFAALIIFLRAAGISGFHEPPFVLGGYKSFFREDTRRLVREKFLKWISLHEKIDPSFAFAAST